jgi:HPt (histidine-containing phosphotransfer) domain-containing protein
VAAAAHTVKGSASNLGAHRLAGLLLALEKQVKAGDLDHARKEFPSIQAEFGRVRSALEAEAAK